ncbi:uncharacterized protein LOC141692102 [Apium graveolens]|uniref:uncharacterized protein LOC141692102 n=1 Tax=Apium graveolens TaxID=4045 RepID=UPI003D7ABB30
MDVVSNSDTYFQQRIDAVGRKGLSPLQKCTATMRMLAYGVSADVVDDYVRIGESIAVECWKKIVYTIFAGSNNDINILDRSPVFDDVLQGRAPESRFATVRGLTCFWDRADIGRIMRACIIMHNMIVEDERDTYVTQFGPLPTYDVTTNGLPEPNLGKESFVPYETYVQISMQMGDRQTHRQLKNDLVEHISQFHNNR